MVSAIDGRMEVVKKKHAHHLQLILLLAIALATTGCSSLSTLVRSNLEGLPIWVYEPQVGREQLAFVGKGIGQTEARARQLAYASILDQLSSYLGEDISSQANRELVANARIEAYQLRITQEFTSREGSNTAFYLLAVGSKPLLEEARTATLLLLQEQLAFIDTYSKQAAAAFRENRDLLAAEFYLEAACIAYQMELEKGIVQYRTLIEQVRKIFSRLSLSLLRSDQTIPSFSIAVRRGSARLSPRVVGAVLEASFESLDGLGNPYEDHEVFFSDSAGQAAFIPQNPGIVSEGNIVVRFKLGKVFDRLAVLDADTAGELSALLEQKVLSFPYRRVSQKALENIVTAIMEYSLQGQLQNTDDAHQEFVKRYREQGLKMDSALDYAVEEDEEFIDSVRIAFPNHSYLVMGKVGVMHTSTATAHTTVTVTGEISIIRLDTGTQIYSTEQFSAVGIDAEGEVAEREAFATFGKIGAGILTRELYR